MPRERIFVDESGDPGLSQTSRRRYFVFGFVYCQDPTKLRKKLKRYLKRLHQRRKYPRHLAELKFSLPYTNLMQQGYTLQQLDNDYSIHMPEIRTKSLEIIRDNCDGVFGAIIDKQSVRPEKNWTSERIGNFVLARSLIVDVMNKVSPPNPPTVYYDKGRLSASKATKFNAYIVSKYDYFQYRGRRKYRGSLSPPTDTSSVLEAGIWAADMVAGSYYHKFENNEWAYSNILHSKKIGSGERIFWR